MADTYTLIGQIKVGSAGASSVVFSGIPQTFSDLKVVLSARSTTTYGNTYYDSYITLNSTAGSGRTLMAYGTTITANTDASNNPIYGITSSGASAGVFGNAEFYIPNYTSSTKKSINVSSVSENNATSSMVHFGISNNNLTSAVTSITITPYGGAKFAQYSSFYLYGIAKVGVQPNFKTPSAVGGDSIVFDGTYWYHTFLSSGTFTPTKSLSCDYLVIAGGGGGAAAIPSANAGGGGGAGGLRCTVTATGGGGSLESPLSLAANTRYAVVVGAGGSGGVQGANNKGLVGSNSSFSTITSIGGGYGGAEGDSGGAGGSGGGSGRKTASQTGGAGTANQGYAGGESVNSGNYPGGGGGGAGAIGANATTTAGGNGGNGVTTSISGTSITYAGGGGGGTYNGGTPGTGGTGGGGNAGATPLNAGSAGTANLGGGGGGATIDGTAGGRGGGNGGSGIVIVRYVA